jgi:tetratricopeptide (TPR) repeat protein
LSTRIPRDLETIVMKAIDKDAKRRYQSADEIGEDLQRFVNDEPIKARRIGVLERLHRWRRRNPAVAGLTAAVLLLMAVGTALSTWQAVVATRARADLAAKMVELKDEQAKVETRNQELAQQQKEVEARFEMAQKAIATLHTGVSEDFLLKNEKFKELRTKLLKEAASFYSDLEKLLAGKTDTKSRKLLADGYFELGVLTARIGDKKEALAVHRKGLALRRELAAVAGADVETRLDVARSLISVGWLLGNTGDLAEAISALQEARDLAAALEAESPTDGGACAAGVCPAWDDPLAVCHEEASRRAGFLP